ncbi:MAG: LacI family DNA-binding transcriptional regulator [Candidatus Methanomethyliaceae archaeon]
MQRLTIREVARAAGVSPATVSRVLNGTDAGHVSAETKERIRSIINNLGYTPSKLARALRKKRAEIIAVVLPDVSNVFFALIARAVEAVCFRYGYATIICDSNNMLTKENQYLDILPSEGVAGIVFVPVGEPDKHRLSQALHAGVPVVVADRHVEGFPVVEAANHEGSQELTKYVISLGYKKILYIAGPKNISTAADRLAGFCQAMEEMKLTPVDILHGNFTYESGYELGKTVFRSNVVDCVVCANDLMAVGVLNAALEEGVSVPYELGIAGFDRAWFAAITRPRLTTVEVPVYQIGHEAASMLLEGRNESKRLKVKLVVGESCCLKKEVIARARLEIKRESEVVKVPKRRVCRKAGR